MVSDKSITFMPDISQWDLLLRATFWEASFRVSIFTLPFMFSTFALSFHLSYSCPNYCYIWY